MFRLALKTHCASALKPLPQRLFSSSSRLSQFKEWNSLSKEDKQKFITDYVELFQKKHPCSKGNVMNHSLAEGMKEYDDTPYVFGIIYSEIKSVALGEPADNKKGEGILGDPEFAKLLYK
ncbi:(ZYRO0E05214g) [Zygosaccharomyces parabailii]|nr:(ZYRO0E05214g) [Zygosaccharomyces parabailii]CDH11662.1 uncharacterized protein ZBAI_03448 [Zygosaccharomyces bailii ISA1307]